MCLLKVTCLGFDEIELNQEIQKIRTGKLVIEAPVGVEVRVEQLRHEFWFGAALANHMFRRGNDSEDSKKYKEVFLANYADGLCDLPLNDFINNFVEGGKVASFISVKPTTYFHIVSMNGSGTVEKVVELPDSGIWMNGGFFALRQSLFDYIKPGEELVNEPFSRLIREGQLVSQKYDGFWKSMDTFKDKQFLDEVFARGQAPWQVWQNGEKGTNEE